MKSTRLGLFGAPFVALAFGFFSLSACGGKVVVDAEGAGGSGGAGTGAGTNGTSTGTNGNGTSTGAIMVSTSTGGPGDPTSLCDAACAQINQLPECSDPSCSENCLSEWAKAGACQDLFLKAVACVVDNAGVGGVCTGAPCEPLADEYKTCLNQSNCTITDVCGGGSDGSCTCAGVCGAGNKVNVSCFPNDLGSSTCVCNLNGSDIATCDGPVGTFPCDIPTSCCAEYF